MRIIKSVRFYALGNLRNQDETAYGEQDGALREYASCPTSSLFPLPDPLSCADGAMLKPSSKPSGAANTIAADDLAHRVEAAQSFGVSQAHFAGDNSQLRMKRADVEERGVDVAFDRRASFSAGGGA